MKRNSTVKQFILVLFFFLLVKQNGSAYETPLHAKMSELALAQSVVALDQDLLASYGLPHYNSGQALRNWAGQTILVWRGEPIAMEGDQLRMTYANLVRLGAILEDELPLTLDRNPFLTGTFQGYGINAPGLAGTSLRSFNHFFDARTGKKLFLPLKADSLFSIYTSPDWALEDQGEIPGQHYSYRDAKQYLWFGLTSKTQELRDEAMGRTFQSLGHVVHHLQDMGSPQHAKADSHCSSPLCENMNRVLSVLLKVPVDIKDDKGSDIYNPSLYEYYTAYLFQKYEQLETAKYSKYPLANLEAVQGNFKKPRDFWTTSPGEPEKGFGIADFSYRNYVTFGTNFQGFQQQSPNNVITHPEYPFPNTEGVNDFLSRMTIKEIRALYPQYGEDLFRVPLPGSENAPPVVLPDDARMAFVATDVKDLLYPSRSSRNQMGSTYSYFDQRLKDPFYRFKRIFSVNSINFLKAYEEVAARSVAYSTLLINQFFRGRIDVTPEKTTDAQTVRLIIRNLGKEPLTGTFQFYYDAKDGMRYRVAGIEKQVSNFLPTKADDPKDGILFEFVLPPFGLEPAERGKYLLTFYGVQGQDSAETGNVTVLARPFTTPLPGSGVLYLAGLDKDGREHHFKVDSNGTQPVSTFDPFSAGLPDDFYPHKPYVLKQVEYNNTGYRVRSLSMYTRRNSLTYANNFVALGQGALQQSGEIGQFFQTQWTASSTNPAIGDFIFGYTNRFQLAWIRYYRGANGQQLSQQGAIPLPQFTGGDGKTYAFPEMNGGNHLAGDGLTLGPFYAGVVDVGTGDNQNYSGIRTLHSAYLKLTLGETPTISIEVKGDQVSTQESRVNKLEYSREIGRVETTPPCFINSSGQKGVTVFSGPITESLSDTISNTRSVISNWVGSFKGTPLKYTYSIENKVITRSASTSYSAGTGSGATGCPTGWYHVGINADTDFYTEHTTTHIFSDGSLVSHDLGLFDRGVGKNGTLNYSYTGEGLLPPYNWDNKSPPFESDGIIANSRFLLTDKVSDLIYSKKSDYYFRGYRFNVDIGYVADSSPLGEVFFATKDLKFIVHEPLNMPRVKIPPNIVKLVAALWL